MDDDDRNDEEAPDNATTVDEDDHPDRGEKQVKVTKLRVWFDVDDTADVEPHDPDSEPEDDTAEHNHLIINVHPESSHDADSNLSFDEIFINSPEVDCMARATHQVGDL